MYKPPGADTGPASHGEPQGERRRPDAGGEPDERRLEIGTSGAAAREAGRA